VDVHISVMFSSMGIGERDASLTNVVFVGCAGADRRTLDFRGRMKVNGRNSVRDN